MCISKLFTYFVLLYFLYFLYSKKLCIVYHMLSSTKWQQNFLIRLTKLKKGSLIFKEIIISQFKIFKNELPLHSQKLVTYFGQISQDFTFLFIREVGTGRTVLNNLWFLENGGFCFGGKFKLGKSFELCISNIQQKLFSLHLCMPPKLAR